MDYHWYKSGDSLLNELLLTNSRLPESSLAIWYVGQMGVIIKGRQLTIGFDLVFNDLCYPDGKSRRNYPPPFCADQLTNMDYIICSHNHADHLNLETLIPLYHANPSAKFIVPAPEVHLLTGAGIPEKQVIAAKDQIPISLNPSNDSLIPVAAPHETYDTDEHGYHHYLGFVLKLNGVTVYHAGDTVFAEGLVKTISDLGPIHLACLPINGAGAEFHSRNVQGNMDAKDAAYMASRLHADLTFPLHFDMVKKNEGNPILFAGYMQTYFPGMKYHILQLGEKFLYSI